MVPSTSGVFRTGAKNDTTRANWPDGVSDQVSRPEHSSTLGERSVPPTHSGNLPAVPPAGAPLRTGVEHLLHRITALASNDAPYPAQLALPMAPVLERSLVWECPPP